MRGLCRRRGGGQGCYRGCPVPGHPTLCSGLAAAGTNTGLRLQSRVGQWPGTALSWHTGWQGSCILPVLHHLPCITCIDQHLGLLTLVWLHCILGVKEDSEVLGAGNASSELGRGSGEPRDAPHWTCHCPGLLTPSPIHKVTCSWASVLPFSP